MRIEPFENLTLSENQLAVLKCLYEIHGDESDCYYFRTIEKETGIEKRLVRLACRALARKGYTEYVRGLFDSHEEWKVAGSGYRCTDAGAEVIERMIDHAQAVEDAKTL